MKKLMLLLIVLTNIIFAMDTSEKDRAFLENELAIIKKNKANLAPLTQLCIRQILRNPGHYIEQDAEHKLPFDLHDNIREYWIKHGRFTNYFKKNNILNIQKKELLRSFFEDRVPLAQLLLLEKAQSILGLDDLELNCLEKEIHNGLLPLLLKWKFDTWDDLNDW